MAIDLTGSEIFTAGLYTTNVGGQKGEMLFSGGIWEGCVEGAVVTKIIQRYMEYYYGNYA